MKRIFFKRFFLLKLFFLASCISFGQSKGRLFIIGGGERSVNLMEELITTAQFRANDYIVILPMATSVPRESIASISAQLSGLCPNKITSFNFSRSQADENQIWIDSVRKARLIYVVGGDQNKFMEVVRGTKLYDAMHDAFDNGATISGTSAGAAIMSEVMITGAEKDTTDRSSFREIIRDNAITAKGMGFVTKAIIDQHFIRRSRYNRLLSVLADHPDKMVIGIDEGTAIVIKGDIAKVVGKSQVVVISPPKRIKWSDTNRAAFQDAQISLLISGDTFYLK